MARGRLIAGQVALGAGGVGAWEWAARAGALDPLFFTRPSHVAARIGEWIASGSIWPHLATTLAEASLSFAIGVGLGVAFGFALARFSWLAALLDPYVRVLNALPRVVLAPLFLLWFGLGIWS
ncbi:MAG: ABC transporter permease [Bryobacteraceae bacterium]